jgi:ribonuclease HII
MADKIQQEVKGKAMKRAKQSVRERMTVSALHHPKPDLSIEQSFCGTVVGIDEAGRGPWAGPVVAGAVILKPRFIPDGINDSKKMTRLQRERLFLEIRENAQFGIGIASVEEIDRLNILQASLLAMARAYENLMQHRGLEPITVLVDGNRCPALPVATLPVVGGDRRSLSIAAASIVAKVTRDRIMHELAESFPHYGWERNAGYGTATHQLALAQHGVTPHHRRSFAPVRALLQNTGEAERSVA